MKKISVKKSRVIAELAVPEYKSGKVELPPGLKKGNKLMVNGSIMTITSVSTNLDLFGLPPAGKWPQVHVEGFVESKPLDAGSLDRPERGRRAKRSLVGGKTPQKKLKTKHNRRS